jgi:hypothetical protein
VLEIGPAWARLVAPQLPDLSALSSAGRLPPWELLLRLADAGLDLLGGGDGQPEAPAAAARGAAPAAAADVCGVRGGGGGGGGGSGGGWKDLETERAMCGDVADVWWARGGRAAAACGPGNGAVLWGPRASRGQTQLLACRS